MSSHPSFEDDPIPDELMQAYRQSIPSKLSLINSLICEVQKNGDLESLKALRFAIHKLAGSAGSYGYPEVSALCKELEKELILKIDDFSLGSLNQNYLAALTVFFQKLEKEFTYGKK